MMTELFVYGYMAKACSSRTPAKAARENEMFMRLAGNPKPGFRALNDFRGKPLKEVVEEIFVTAAKTPAAKGYIKPGKYFVDGTKIGPALGRRPFVWKKAVEGNNKKREEKLRAYIRTADKAWEEENAEYGDRGLEELGGGRGIRAPA